MNGRSASGMRKSPFYLLTVEDIEYLINEIRAIGADEEVFMFNRGARTSYSDTNDIVLVRGDFFPDQQSTHPRDLMSPRAVLAHEYYGHRAYRYTHFLKGAWNDEFRASYIAAKNTPNLSDDDRRCLVLDAIERAKEAGITIKNNEFIRGVLYGY